MNTLEHSIKMANQIGSFFESMPDSDQAMQSAATHIQKFWDPRMRKLLLEAIETNKNLGLTEFMQNSLQKYGVSLLSIDQQ